MNANENTDYGIIRRKARGFSGKAMCLDQYFTKPEIAYSCLENLCTFLNSTHYGYDFVQVLFLEPSAGEGAFIRALALKNYDYRAYDIEPRLPQIIQKDFLTDDIKLPKSPRLVITIGNPPFGKRASQAIAFINRATEYSDTIAFILPLTFRKYSTQKQLDNRLRLVFDQDLPCNSFLYNGKDYNVRCCFQVWTTRSVGEDKRLYTPPLLEHPDFEMWQYNNTKEAEKYFDKSKYGWDFAVPRQGYKDYTIRETNPANMSRHTQWIFFKAHDSKALNRLLKLDYEALSKKNISTPSFGKADVVEAYNKLYPYNE